MFQLLVFPILVKYCHPWNLSLSKKRQLEIALNPITSSSISSVYALVWKILRRLGLLYDTLWLFFVAFDWSNEHLPTFLIIYLHPLQFISSINCSVKKIHPLLRKSKPNLQNFKLKHPQILYKPRWLLLTNHFAKSMSFHSSLWYRELWLIEYEKRQ